MFLWKRAALLGFLSWLIPFAISIPAFPLKQANGALFETFMTLVVLLTAVALLPVYFRNRTVSVPDAVLTGALWFLVNLVFDYPMFAYGPMKMTAGHYYSAIGLDYLVFPVFAFGAARLARS
ncbi:MAG TPA: hypothetical protein VE959_10780 [Bryobacteraceae bacterium]|nr:hypothetical protein [Bryobacteraceae bacterium]